jgi:hypothetical protein
VWFSPVICALRLPVRLRRFVWYYTRLWFCGRSEIESKFSRFQCISPRDLVATTPLSGIKLPTCCLQQIILVAKPTAMKIGSSQDLSLKRSLSVSPCPTIPPCHPGALAVTVKAPRPPVHRRCMRCRGCPTRSDQCRSPPAPRWEHGLAQSVSPLGWASRCGPPWPCGLPRAAGSRSAEAMVLGQNWPDGSGNPFPILVSFKYFEKIVWTSKIHIKI